MKRLGLGGACAVGFTTFNLLAFAPEQAFSQSECIASLKVYNHTGRHVISFQYLESGQWSVDLLQRRILDKGNDTIQVYCCKPTKFRVKLSADDEALGQTDRFCAASYITIVPNDEVRGEYVVKVVR